MFGWLSGWQVVWLAECWLSCCLVGLVGWLVGWLVDAPTGVCMRLNVMRICLQCHLCGSCQRMNDLPSDCAASLLQSALQVCESSHMGRLRSASSGISLMQKGIVSRERLLVALAKGHAVAGVAVRLSAWQRSSLDTRQPWAGACEGAFRNKSVQRCCRSS